jgi:ubiquinone biosynthesis protein UbiJ
MLVGQLLSAGVELTINQLLQLDPDCKPRLKKLAGTQLQVSINELPWSLLFIFSEQIDVSALPATSEDQSSEAQAPTESSADCHITLSLSTLSELSDSSKISQLIQQGKLDLDGDINVAQGFSNLIKELDIDWEEQLSKYTGDVVAHQTFSSVKAFFNTAQQEVEKLADQLSTHLTKPDAVAVSEIEVADFCDQVNTLRSASDRLEARIDQLIALQQDDS